MNINTVKLSEIITSSIKEVSSKSTPWLDSTTLIGEIDGLQIQIKVTSEDSEFIDDLTSNNECIKR